MWTFRETREGGEGSMRMYTDTHPLPNGREGLEHAWELRFSYIYTMCAERERNKARKA